METTVTPFNSSTSLSNLSQLTSSQPFKSDIDFDPQKAPGKIAHNSDPNSCYVAVLLNTIRDENLKSLFMVSKITDKQIAKDLREVLWPCINKINQGSLKRDYRCDEGVVSIEEISKIQAVLRRHNIIERDASTTDEDPMGVLHCVLEHVAPEFILFKGTETHHYTLKEAKKSEEVILTETELGCIDIQ